MATPTVIESEAKRIFLELLDAPADDRPVAAAAACGGDGAVRARVEALLRAHESAEREAVGVAGAMPERIGGYRVVRVLASGGMGVVYEAEQEQPRRPVAIKVLRAWAATPTAVRRFELEAELLGRLRHPGIAQVFEAGRAVVRPGAPDEPVPFIAMELIPGAKNLVRHARERGLALRDRIRLLADVSAAVQAAHERGVIHRDLKPGNILVGDDGRARVIDFGVARLTDLGGSATLHTVSGQVVGTLGYMSPELAGGGAAEADVRTDVYALGVLLYELATDRPPHDITGKTIAAALRVIQESDADWPAGRGRLWRDLGAIAVKAMARRPGARYESAGALARDLERLLAGDTVEARPPGRWSRLARWTVRHPIAATACACVAVVGLTLAATAAGIYWLALRPDHLFEHGSPRFLALRSRGGHVLHVWDAGERGRTRFSAMVERPEALGGGRIALIGFEYDTEHSAEPGHVEAFDASRPDRRLWSTADTPLTPPGAYAARPDTVLSIELALLADVFEGVPGPELIVLHALGGSSPTAIRVFDLAGRARYEVWHEGGVLAARWMPGVGRLVFCGLNSEARWDERGVDLRDPFYPCIVGAVEPRDGHRPSGAWLVEGGRRADPTLGWYRWLGPVETLRGVPRVGMGLERAGAGWADGSHVTLAVAMPGASANAHVRLTLDAAGVVVRRASDDQHKMAMRSGAAPPVEAFELLEYEALPAVTDR